jgi:hypothetical protein
MKLINEIMEKEFINYEQAIELRDLGFDEECLAFYDYYPPKPITLEIYCHCDRCDNSGLSTPTFSHAFKFFRDKYDLYYTIEGSKKYGFAFFIYCENDDKDELKSKEYSTYEEAEQGCLIKLIEITKEKL